MKKLIFISCKKMGCKGNCSSFKLAYETTQKLSDGYYDEDNTFKRICGDDSCLMEVEEEDEPT